MKISSSSIWVLYKSFFDAVPGQRGLLAIGLLSMTLGYVVQGSSHSTLFILAGIAFMAGFTLFFAGAHFRQLVSFKRHRLLPGFRTHLVISYLIALASLSLFVLAGFALLSKQDAAKLIPLNDISTGMMWLGVLALVLMASFVGFLPRYLRYPAWVLIVGAANSHALTSIPFDLLLHSIIGLSIASLACFIYFFGVLENPVFYAMQSSSLSKYVPGLNGSFQERGVTAVGSLLLGMSDGNASRFSRVFFCAFLLPAALACSVALTTNSPAEQLFRNPLFMLTALMTGVMLQLHFAFTVGARRRFIWLRVGGDRYYINEAARKVLARERWSMVLGCGLWCAPAIGLYPSAAVWLLGVGTLLWCMMLVLEQAILALKVQLSRRAEFYTLLTFVGLVVGVIATAKMHGQPGILWLGVLAMLFLYAVNRSPVVLRLWQEALG